MVFQLLAFGETGPLAPNQPFFRNTGKNNSGDT
jgi:hypothetical protein